MTHMQINYLDVLTIYWYYRSLDNVCCFFILIITLYDNLVIQTVKILICIQRVK